MKDKIKYCYQNMAGTILYNKESENASGKPMEGVLNTEEQVPFITFPSFSALPFLKHGFSTRLGGVSRDYLGTMNLSYQRGDEPACVTENFKRICQAIGICPNHMVRSDQIHKTVIYRATEKDWQGDDYSINKLSGVDGLITNVPDVVLVTSYADCVPLFLADSKKKAIGLSHSGWKGTVGKIGAKTAKALEKNYGSRMEDIIAVIGPSICQKCYEISEETALEFQASLGAEKKNLILVKKENGKYQLDLWYANKLILQEAGIPAENISISGICTCCNNSLLYSHRATQGKRGNMGAFLSLR